MEFTFRPRRGVPRAGQNLLQSEPRTLGLDGRCGSYRDPASCPSPSSHRQHPFLSPSSFPLVPWPGPWSGSSPASSQEGSREQSLCGRKRWGKKPVPLWVCWSRGRRLCGNPITLQAATLTRRPPPEPAEKGRLVHPQPTSNFGRTGALRLFAARPGLTGGPAPVLPVGRGPPRIPEATGSSRIPGHGLGRLSGGNYGREWAR